MRHTVLQADTQCPKECKCRDMNYEKGGVTNLLQGPSGKETGALVDAVNKSGRAFMITTELSGRTVARFALGGAQTQECHVRAAWQLISDTADSLLADAQQD